MSLMSLTLEVSKLSDWVSGLGGGGEGEGGCGLGEGVGGDGSGGLGGEQRVGHNAMQSE